MPYTFSAKGWGYFINLIALMDGIIRAFRFTNITVDTFVRNSKRHDKKVSTILHVDILNLVYPATLLKPLVVEISRHHHLEMQSP